MKHNKLPDEETMKQLAVYDNARPRLIRSAGFTKIGGISRDLTRSRKTLQNVTVREIEDPERENNILPFIPRPRQKQTGFCSYCRQDYDIDGNIHGWFRGADGQPEPCPECSVPVIRARNRRKAEKNIKSLVTAGFFLDMQNLPIDASGYSMQDYPGDPEAADQVWAFIRGTIREMALIGPVGRGKTGLAISAVHELWKEKKLVVFLPMEQYLDLIKANFEKGTQDNQIKQVASTVDVLVVDDLAAGQSTIFTIKETLTLLEARHAAGLQTLITSNMWVKQLQIFWHLKDQEQTFQPGERLTSRLRGWYKKVLLNGDDLRGGDE